MRGAIVRRGAPEDSIGLDRRGPQRRIARAVSLGLSVSAVLEVVSPFGGGEAIEQGADVVR